MSYKKIVILASFLAIFSFLFSFNMPSVEAMTAAEIEAMIQQIQARIAPLQQQLVLLQQQLKQIQRTNVLTVNSSGALRVPITGNIPVYTGTTNYLRTGIPARTFLTLTAPATHGGRNFSNWTGCDLGMKPGSRICNLTMNANRTVTANYVLPATITIISPNRGERWVRNSRVIDSLSWGVDSPEQIKEIIWMPKPSFEDIHGTTTQSPAIEVYLLDLNKVRVGRILPFGYGSLKWIVGVVGKIDCSWNHNDANYCWSRNNLFLVHPGQYYVEVHNRITNQSDTSDALFNILSMCTDSDGGKDYYTRGYVKGVDGYGRGYIYYDECLSDKILYEYFCTPEGFNTREEYICPHGCRNGACIKESAPSITVLSPNGGERWEAGKTYTVRWNKNNLPADTNWRIFIDFMWEKTPHDRVQQNIFRELANSGNIEWSIPSTITPGNYRILVMALKPGEGNATYSDTSDHFFSIVAPVVVTHTLTVNSSGVASVRVAGNPPVYSGTTNYSRTGIPAGTFITLTAPATHGGRNFSNWTGCDLIDPVSRICNLTMNANRTVTAHYVLPPPLIPTPLPPPVTACTRRNPGITIYPPSQSARPGTRLTYAVSVVNNDSAGCGPSVFNLAIQRCPAGWTCTLSQPSVSLDIGAGSGAPTIFVTSPSLTIAGANTFTVRVSNSRSPSHLADGSGNYQTTLPIGFKDLENQLASISAAVFQLLERLNELLQR